MKLETSRTRFSALRTALVCVWVVGCAAERNSDSDAADAGGTDSRAPSDARVGRDRTSPDPNPETGTRDARDDVPDARGPSTVVTYPAPAGYPAHPDYEVRVDGRPVHVYAAKVSTEDRYRPRPHQNATATVGFAIFDHDGPVTVTVRVKNLELTHAQIKPRRRGISATREGNTLRFTLPRPDNVVLELDQDIFKHLYFFTNPLEEHPVAPTDPNVTYLGPGVHEQTITPAAGQTVYLAGGAVVKGKITVRGRQNVTIRGRGILDGAALDGGNLLLIEDASHVDVSQIVLVDSPSWSLRLHGAKQVALSSVRIFGWRQNSDGIDLSNAEDVTVKGCFVRTFDDSVVVKVMDDDFRTGGALDNGVSQRLHVSGCLLIQDHGGGPLKIGANEMLGLSVSDVTFVDNDLLGTRGEALLLIRNQGTAEVSKVLFQDIHADGARISYTGVQSGLRTAQVRLLKLGIGTTNAYVDTFAPGHISDVTFRRVEFVGDIEPPLPPHCVLEGVDAQHRVERVVIEDVSVLGQKFESTASTACSLDKNAYADAPTFRP